MTTHQTSRILIIEDEVDMAELVANQLKKEGFDVTTQHDGVSGWQCAQQQIPDLILLDLMLPEMTGLELLRKLCSNDATSSIPVIIVSAKGEESDVVVGLHLGADDYVTKPFSMAILIARVNSVLRRHREEPPKSGKLVRVGPLTIDPDRYIVTLDGEPISLTRTEFRLLLALASAQGRVLTRYQLIDHAIGMDAIVTDRAIDVHLTALRSKLGKSRKLIETVRGVGYRIAENGR